MTAGRAAGGLALVAAAVLAVGLGSTYSDPAPLPRPASGSAAPTTRTDWLALSRRLAAPWPDAQLPSGHVRDPVRAGGQGTYGDGTIGLAMLQTGARDRDRRLTRAGLRAVTAETRSPDFHYNTHPFRVWVVAAAYGLARRRLARLPAARAALHRWAHWLRQQPSTWLWGPPYENKVLVGALGVLEAERTGLRSAVEGSVFSPAARARARQLVNQTIPSMASEHRAFVLSDPPQNPIAYHALSYAMYARAVNILGHEASSRTRDTLRRLARATWLTMAPDGSTAYWGRSQGQGWTLSAAAYGLAATARGDGSPPAADRRHHALATRALSRLRGYGVGPRGGHAIPALAQDQRAALKALDPYAHTPEYAGLSLVFLNWAIPLLPPGRVESAIAADLPMTAVLSGGSGRFATVRRGRVWFAARQGAGDLRYDFGPVAAQRLGRHGWRDVIPYRPNGGRRYDSAGPVLLSAGGPGLPVGNAIRAARNGRVTVRGGFRRRGRWLRQGVTFSIRPTACGVEVGVRGRAGDRYEFSAFFRGKRGRQVARFNLPARTTATARGYHSASHARLTRARYVVEARRAQWVSMELC